MKLEIRHIPYLFLVILCSLSLQEANGENYNQTSVRSKYYVNWDEVKNSFSQFFNYPSSKNAENVLVSIPFGEFSGETGDRAGTFELVRDKFLILQAEAISGSRTAAELLFRLLGFADGADALDIRVTLGLLIRVNPKLFLDYLLIYKDVRYFKDGYPVVAVGPSWDSKSERRYEYEMRIKSLESSREHKFEEIINQCIQQIKSMIFQLSL